MKVNKEIYYHANSGDSVSIGDIIVFYSNTHNKMYDDVYYGEFKLVDCDANELLIYKKKNQNTNFTIEEFETILNTINHDAFVLRELALEEVRKTDYPEYPS